METLTSKSILIDPAEYAQYLVDLGYTFEDIQHIQTQADKLEYAPTQWKWDMLTAFVNHFGVPSRRP